MHCISLQILSVKLDDARVTVHSLLKAPSISSQLIQPDTDNVWKVNTWKSCELGGIAIGPNTQYSSFSI